VPLSDGGLVAWLAQWWAFLATLIVVFAPGLVASWAIGLRRLGAWAFAPVGSVAMISVLAAIYGLAHIPWNALSAWIGLVVGAAVLVGIRLLLRVRTSRPHAVGARWPVIAGLVVGGVLIAVRVLVYIGEPTNFSQSNDAAFHLGAVRAIIETGHASSLGLAGLIDPEAIGGFYPGAWHATASLIALAGGDILVATNTLSVVVAAVVWPLGIAWLTQLVTGRRLAAAAAAAMAPTIVIFPLLMVQYGVLYAYFLAVALLPAAVAAVLTVTGRGWHAGSTLVGRIAALTLAAGMSAAALIFAQPSVLLAWGLMLWLCGALWVVQHWRRRGVHRLWSTAGLVVAGVALALAWWRMRDLVTADVWRAYRSGKDAAIQILTAGFVETPPAWWVSLLAVAGLFAVLRRARTRWIAFALVAFAGLAFVAYAIRNPTLRVVLVGPWYSDPYRLASLIPVVLLPIAAAGVVLIADYATSRLVARRRARGEVPRPDAVNAGIGAVALAVLGVIAIGVVAANPLVLRYKLQGAEFETESAFALNADTWVNTDEVALMRRAAAEVGDGIVLVNPDAGGHFGYAISGLRVFPAKWQLPRSSAYALVSEDLHDVATDPAVCAAVKALGASYVLDFGPGGDRETGRAMMPGFTDLEGVPGFELVDSQGDASLWRITACS
jgi:hypothetical protein